MLGKGTFAEVRVAEHRIAKTKVAVKIIKKAKMTEKQIERTRNEIETLKLCQHPNIMRLYEIYENADHLYLVLEHLSGGNLHSYMKVHGFSVPETFAYKCVIAIAHALDYMHRYGIVHRDIKPDNVVLSSAGEDSDFKIVDFGLAAILGAGQLSDDPVGTLCYAAPELLLGQKYGKTVDLWSLGVVAHLLLVGYLPFNHQSSEREIAKYSSLQP